MLFISWPCLPFSLELQSIRFSASCTCISSSTDSQDWFLVSTCRVPTFSASPMLLFCTNQSLVVSLVWVYVLLSWEHYTFEMWIPLFSTFLIGKTHFKISLLGICTPMTGEFWNLYKVSLWSLRRIPYGQYVCHWGLHVSSRGLALGQDLGKTRQAEVLEEATWVFPATKNFSEGVPYFSWQLGCC